MLDTVCVQYKSAAAVAPRAPTNNFGGADHGPVEARRPAGGAAGARTCACVHACDLRARAHAPRSRPRAVLHPWPAMCPPPSAPPPRTCIRAPTAYLHSRPQHARARRGRSALLTRTLASASPPPFAVVGPGGIGRHPARPAAFAPTSRRAARAPHPVSRAAAGTCAKIRAYASVRA